MIVNILKIRSKPGQTGYVLKTISIESLSNLIIDIKEDNEIVSPYVLFLNRDS